MVFFFAKKKTRSSVLQAGEAARYLRDEWVTSVEALAGLTASSWQELRLPIGLKEQLKAAAAGAAAAAREARLKAEPEASRTGLARAF